MFKFTFVSLVFLTAIGSVFAYDNKPVVGMDLIRSGDSNEISRLIKDGAKVNSLDEYGVSPLAYAVALLHPELVEFLIDNGADVNLPNKDGQTPIFFATNFEIFELLVDAGADVNHQAPDGGTALIGAIFMDEIGQAEALVKHGADVNVLNPNGRSPLNILNERKNTYKGKFEENLRKLIIAAGGKDISIRPRSKVSGRRIPDSGEVDCEDIRSDAVNNPACELFEDQNTR